MGIHISTLRQNSPLLIAYMTSLTNIHVRKVCLCKKIKINSCNEFNKGLFLDKPMFCALMQF